MNTELKLLLDAGFDAANVAQDVLKHDYISMVGAMTKLMADTPSILANLGDLEAEIQELPGTAQESDLVAYIEQKFAGVGTPKAQSILACALKVIEDLAVVLQDSLALKTVIQG